jgi:hypothetical protein
MRLARGEIVGFRCNRLELWCRFLDDRGGLPRRLDQDRQIPALLRSLSALRSRCAPCSNAAPLAGQQEGQRHAVPHGRIRLLALSSLLAEPSFAPRITPSFPAGRWRAGRVCHKHECLAHPAPGAAWSTRSPWTRRGAALTAGPARWPGSPDPGSWSRMSWYGDLRFAAMRWGAARSSSAPDCERRGPAHPG